MKSKISSSFVCQQCGYDTPQWLGKCPECGEWNSLKEFKVKSSKLKFGTTDSSVSGVLAPKKINEIKLTAKERIPTGFLEVDTVFGGGIVSGSVTLLAGDPGIGKSTLLLQVALLIARQMSVLYVSGEESEDQIVGRIKRVSKEKENNLLILNANNIDEICSIVQESKPDFLIIDSIQTMESEKLEGLSGSVGQVRYAATALIRLAKALNIPTLIVGHVTKEGMVAGPMVLSHMVDTVLFMEGEKNTGTRILRSLKNRFGPVDEVGVFLMSEAGMEEVKNPENIFLEENKNNSPGSILTVTMEGTRAFLVEIQALAVYSKLPIPRRVASGIDAKKLELLLAVLQKHARLPVDSNDIFVNVAGGLKLSDPACDLAICLAIYSSLKNISLSNMVAFSEVGLLGELRKSPMLEKRVKQAKKLGFKKIISSQDYKAVTEVIKLVS